MSLMLRCQAFSSIAIGILAAVVSFNVVFGGWGISWTSGACALVLSYVLTRVGLLMMVAATQYIFYGGDYEAMKADAESSADYFYAMAMGTVNQLPEWGDESYVYPILQSGDRIGTYQDVPFFEWIEVMGRDGLPHRFTFSGARDKRKALARDCIQYPPGIVYQVVAETAPAINKSA